MPTYFHVDRANRLREEGIFTLSSHSSPRWFPGGLSEHGQRYLNGDFQFKFANSQGQERGAVSQDTGIELLWELVRLNEYPQAPSRLQSVFAFERLEEARQFAEAEQRGTIWEIEVEQPGFRADMSLLKAEPRTGNTLQLARYYWGQLNDQDRSQFPPEFGPPVWEHLLTPPVRVIRRVGIGNHPGEHEIGPRSGAESASVTS
ncbi:hypothetical protein [Nocardia farcinica]|uniref:hypothetical protein n=1 Tax=Nocardia farcinica TaxID=37329 RepID=UPI002458E3E1|nr:hypothetical protein [Nocardia farcinica]